MTEAYPLRWPQGRPRTQSYYRKNGAFKKDGRDISIRDAMRRMQDELDRIGGSDFVLSANLVRNMDGSPRSNQPQPVDPGVALYFTLKKKPICMPCDTYTRVEQNIAAIAKHIEATRAIERYGVASLSEMFTGFEALPAPGKASKRHWRDVLGVVPRDLALDGRTNIIDALYRERAKQAHPDRGGTHDMMAELNAARADAIKEINQGGKP
jgi:hypothetical protein